MNEQNRFLTRLQAAVYLVELVLLSGMFALAASSSPEFALGPVARIFVAAALPLPCHLMVLAQVVWAGRRQRRWDIRPVLTLRPQPFPA